MTMTADGSLLQSYAKGRIQGAFSKLVERHLDAVYSAALRRVGGDAHLAEDVIQQVFAALAQNAEKLSKHPVLCAWLFTTTRNVAAQLVRSERRRKAREKVSQAMDHMSQTTAEANWNQIGPVLDEIIDQLSEGDRQAVLLRFIDRRGFAEIGDALRLTEDAARMKVDRALDKLRTLLARRGIKSSSAALGGLLVDQVVCAAPAGLAATVTTTVIASASGGGAAVAFFTLMSTTKIATGVAGIIAILAIGSTVHMSRVAGAAREALLKVEEDRNHARAEIRDLKLNLESKTRDAAKSAAGRLESQAIAVMPPQQLQAPTSTLTELSPNLIQRSNPLASFWSLRSSPEAMRAWIQAERSGLQLQLGPLFKKLDLSSSQADEVKSIMMAKFQAIADVVEAGASQGVPVADPIIKDLIRETAEKTEHSLHRLLGDGGYEELRRFGETMNVREVVKILASHSYYTETPLTSIQSDRLVQIIAAQSTKTSTGYDLQSTNWEKVFEDAQGVLANAQIVLLRAERDQLRLKQQLTNIQKASASPAPSNSATAKKP